MKPYIHSKNSAKKYGGKPSEYLPIHDFMDSSKAVVPDMRHRAIFHSAFGCFIVEKVFGTTITNSDGKEISTRDIAEDHILEDLGCIPTLQDWLSEMTFQEWMMSPDLREKQKAKDEKQNVPKIGGITEDIFDALSGKPKEEKPIDVLVLPPMTEIKFPERTVYDGMGSHDMVLDGFGQPFLSEEKNIIAKPIPPPSQTIKEGEKPNVKKSNVDSRTRVVDGKRGSNKGFGNRRLLD